MIKKAEVEYRVDLDPKIPGFTEFFVDQLLYHLDTLTAASCNS